MARLVGAFDPNTKRARFPAKIRLERQRVVGDLMFDLDTGTGDTLTSPADALRLGVDYARLHRPESRITVGGTQPIHFEEAQLIFLQDDDTPLAYDFKVGIMPNDLSLWGVTSLLGLDVVNRWDELIYSFPRNLAEARVSGSGYLHWN